LRRALAPLSMRGVEGVRNLQAKGDDTVERQRLAADLLLERLPLHQLHHDEGAALLLADVMDRADGGWLRAEAVRASREKRSSASRLSAISSGRNFTATWRPESDVLRLVDEAHAAPAQQRQDPVV
jgi:hypothetical protein